MIKHLLHLNKQIIRFFTGIILTQKQLALICRIVFIAAILPLILIALFNYPADDDFQFTLPAAAAFIHTRSLLSVFQSIVNNTKQTFMIWQGNFVSTFLFSVNPMIFNIDLYFLTSWYILALLCLSVGYLLKGVSNHYLRVPRSGFAIVYTAVMVLVLQFMPQIGDGVFWHNGGQYTVAACLLMLILGLLLRCNEMQSARKGIKRGIALALSSFALGGCFYGPALGAFVIFFFTTLISLLQKGKLRWHSLIALTFFTFSFAISITAPGNLLRQERLGGHVGIISVVITTVLDSFDLTGRWISSQLLAMLMLILPILWKPLKESAHRFKHPFWVMVILYGMYASTLTPGIYTGFGYVVGRYINIVYLYFLIMVLGSLIYAEGSLIRLLERNAAETTTSTHVLSLFSERIGQRFSTLYLFICIGLLILGGFANTIMNTSSISAAKSLLTGEAMWFRQEMNERQEYIRVTDSDVVAVEVLSGQPYVFKRDRLPFQGIYGTVRYMKWYFELFE